MELVQKKFPFGTWRFELQDDRIRVEKTQILSRLAYEVPYILFMDYEIAERRNFPLGSLVFALLSFFCSIGLAAILHFDRERLAADQGIIVISMFLLICLAATFICFRRFLQEIMDAVVVLPENGRAILIHRAVPSEKDVKNFLADIHKKIKTSRSKES